MSCPSTVCHSRSFPAGSAPVRNLARWASGLSLEEAWEKGRLQTWNDPNNDGWLLVELYVFFFVCVGVGSSHD